VDRIARAATSDYEQLTRLGQYCFGHDAGALDWRWNHVWGAHLGEPACEVTDRFLVWKEEGRALGMLAIVPMTLLWGAARIAVAGVSSVATHPEHRGRGIMSALLERACAEMQQAGYLLSDLGGDRARYGNYGWEPVGLQALLQFGGKYLRALPDPQAPPVHVTAGDARAAAALLALCDRRDPRYERGPRQLEWLLHRRGAEFWAIPDAGGFACYLAAFDDTVVEYAGRPDMLPGLIKHFARMHSLDKVIVRAPARFGASEEMLYRLCGYFTLATLHSWRIVRFAELMRALAPAIASRVRETDTAPAPLALTLADTGETVTLRWQADAVAVEDGAGAAATLALDRRDMARLLLGPFTEGLLAPLGAQGAQGRPWAATFPLPFHCSWMDTV
jgi:GNAT superfamily N-acetyltransferase